MFNNNIIVIATVPVGNSRKFILQVGNHTKEMEEQTPVIGATYLKYGKVEIRCRDGYVYSTGYVAMSEIVLAQMMAAVVIEKYPELVCK
jgi:hypothetical protein